jgi:hypothetical protein
MVPAQEHKAVVQKRTELETVWTHTKSANTLEKDVGDFSKKSFSVIFLPLLAAYSQIQYISQLKGLVQICLV